MDTKYLKKQVGESLAEALADTAIATPEDPVAHLAGYLLKWADTREAEAAAEAERSALVAEHEEAQKANAAVASIASDEAAEKDKIRSSKAALLEALNSDAPDASDAGATAILGRVLEFLSEATRAPNAHIGRRLHGDEEDANAVTWVVSNEEGVCWKTISGEEGVTGEGLFSELEEAEEAEEEEGAPPPRPRHIHVANVLRGKPRPKFIKAPRIGSYLAVDVKYNSPLIADALEWKEAAEGEEANPVPSDSRHLVIGLDTLGEGVRPFSKTAVELTQDIAEALSSAMEKLELAQLKEQQAAAAKLEEQKEGDMSKLGAAADALNEKLDNIEDEFEKKGVEFDAHKAALIAAVSSGATNVAASLRVLPNDDVLKGCYAAAVAAGIPDADLQENGKPSWDRVRRVFDASFGPKVEAFSTSALSAEDVAGLREKVDDADVGAMQEASVSLSLLLQWAKSAVEKAEAEAEQAAVGNEDE